VAIRLSRIAINRFFAVLENRNVQLAGTSEQRRTLRFSTFSNVLKNLSSGLMIGVGILVSLSAIGINIAPLLAGAGILGLGISLGSQNLIKDTINGFFVLLEDQYAVGDVIVVGDVGGMVENMNLRITQLRNGEGRLITIPNGAITVVQNLSKEWARVDLTFDISYQSDVEPALALIQEVMDEIYNDVEWREKIIAPPEVLGIDRMDHAGMMIRVWIRVKPLQHWSVGRECRRRLKPRLDAAGISIGIPQQTLMFNNSLELLSLKDGNVDRQDENAEAFTTNRVDRLYLLSGLCSDDGFFSSIGFSFQ
jgi:small conductance mechanosensitive channel